MQLIIGIVITFDAVWSLTFSSDFPHTDRQTANAGFSLCSHLSHHTLLHIYKFRVEGSLSESGGRPAVTAWGLHCLTGGGESTHLIDSTKRLLVESCRCSLQHAALIWWRTLSLICPLSSFICPLLLLLPFFLFHPLPHPLFSFHSATPSFYLPQCCSFCLPHQHIPL